MRVVYELVQDLRYALRMMRRSAGFTAVAVISLALGIGATTAMFSVVDALVLTKLPALRPRELVMFREHLPPYRSRTDFPYGELLRFRDETPMFSSVAAVNLIDRSTDDGARVRVALVSGNYFTTFGVRAAAGRTLIPDDDRVPGGHAVAVISEGYRARRFARAADVLDRTLTINTTRFVIVGVAADGFAGDWVGRPVDIWVPTMMQAQVMVEVQGALTRKNDYWLRLVARLQPGVSIQQAESALQPVYQRVMKEWMGPDASATALQDLARQSLELEPIAHGYSPQRETFGSPLAILTAVIGLVLLVTCANVASLLLARSADRQREVAVRLALGAGRARLIRQMLTESILLASLGGALGVMLAVWGTRSLAAIIATGPVQMFFASSSWISFDVRLNAAALGFAAAICLLTGTMCGLAPAVRGIAIDRPARSLVPALAARGAAADGAAGRFSLGKTLVVAQVALSLVVLIVAALFVRTLANLQSYDLGFDREHVLLVWTQPSATGRRPDAFKVLWQAAAERLAALPGVVSASASNGSILNGDIPTAARLSDPMRVAGVPPKPTTIGGYRTFVMPRFFETIGVPLVAGREFTDRDTETAPPVVIINETLARHYFGRENPVGRFVGFNWQKGTPTEIVGVVRDFERGTPRAAGRQQMLTYFPYRDVEAPTRLVVMCAVVRTAGDPRALAGRVREALHGVDPALPILKIDTVDEQLADVLAPDRLIAGLAAFFGAVAVLLSCLGLYGLVAHMTARRTSEIGIRMALGASGREIRSMIVAEGLGLVAVGVVIGVPLTLAAPRLASARLFGVSAADPLTLVIATVLMIAVSAVAGFVPAARASRVDPMRALRCE